MGSNGHIVGAGDPTDILMGGGDSEVEKVTAASQSESNIVWI
jgi:hypothetical protein